MYDKSIVAGSNPGMTSTKRICLRVLDARSWFTKPVVVDNTTSEIHWRDNADRFHTQNWAISPIQNVLPSVGQSTWSQLMLGNLGVGIVISNSCGTITLANAAAKRLAQRDPEGKSLTVASTIWGTLFDASDRRVPLSEWPCMRALRGEITIGLECRLVRRDGGACNLLFGSCPIRDAGSQISGSFSSLTDVSEQKWREAGLRQDAVARERARLAADIHDTLAQGLTAVVLQLEALEQELLENPEQARARLRRVRNMARENLAEARRSIWALSREAHEEECPAAALAFLARKLFAGTPTQLQLHLEECGRRLDSTLRVELLRIGKEALTNVLKHARATIVRVELRYARKSVRLSVLDNGCGFGDVPLANAQGGFGLNGLRIRAEHLGGKVVVRSRPGLGTRVVATVPLLA